MDWWQFAVLAGTCVGTALAGMAVLRYKVEELRRVGWERWAGSPSQVTGRSDCLVMRSSTYHPRSAWELRRRSDLRHEVADIGYKVAGLQREQTELRREQTNLRREQAQLQREQDELRRQQAALRRQQQTLRQGLAEVRGYLRGLNL